MTAGIIFMGTPDFAVPALEKLIAAWRVAAVVTQPDRPKGRGRKLMASPVKEAALAARIPVLQPPTLKDPQAVAQLRALKPAVIVVAAFGQILKTDVLTMAPFGCLNIHASLLPRWRGAAPVAAAIKAGDAQTGVTIMRMDEGLDTGPVLQARAIPIQPNHTRASLTTDLAQLGAALLLETLPRWLAGEITPRPQDDASATLAPRLKKAEGQIDWRQTAPEIERHIRAFYPWPGAFTRWRGRPLKILGADSVEAWPAPQDAGRTFWLDKHVAVATGRGALLLQTVQPAGKRPMTAADLARGAADFIGARF